MEVIPSKLRNLWNDWELRLSILLCLALQILLILVGNRRKFNPHRWIRMVIWSAYLSADSLATVALAMLSSKLGDVDVKSGMLDEKSRLMAFWAPCILFLLGGPDNITAYALEDNELWLRHLLGVAFQTGVTAYIYLMAWSVSHLSLLSFLMIIAGATKYAERTWVLWLASSEKRKDLMLATPDPGPNYPRFMEEYSLKKAEGYDVTADEIIENQIRADYSMKIDSSIKDAAEIVKAYRLIQIFKRLFTKLRLSKDDRDASRAEFEFVSWENAFKITEIELGFMYDLLYSKATVLYSRWGFGRHLITLSITCSVLTSFSIAKKPHYDEADLTITYLLLVAVTLLEIYSIVMLLSSDRTDVWLCTSDRSLSFHGVVTSLQLCKQPRWSNSVGQFSLLSFCLKERPLLCRRMLKLINVYDKVEKHHYTLHEEIPNDLKDSIFRHVKARYNVPVEEPMNYKVHLSEVLHGYGSKELKWSIEGPLDQIIITWHVATELCYYYDYERGYTETKASQPFLKFGRILARYMFYLLVMYPFMLPRGIAQIRLRDTTAEAIKALQERLYNKGEETSYCSYFKNCSSFHKNLLKKREHASDNSNQSKRFTDATKMLLEVNTELPPGKVKGGRSKSVLFDGCIIASKLAERSRRDINLKWEMVYKLWQEMLLYAACHCEADQHARQLPQGGELITHVWHMLAHFGLTDHFEIIEGRAIAKLILK